MTRVPYYEGILEHLPEDMRVFNEEDYLQDCQDRAASACSSFQYTNTGFTAQWTPTGAAHLLQRAL